MWIHSLVIGHLYISILRNDVFRGSSRFAFMRDSIDGLRWHTIRIGSYALNIDWLW